MHDPGQKLAKLRGRLQVRWDDARTSQVQRRVLQSQRRQLTMRIGGACALAMLFLLLGPRLWHAALPRTATAPLRPDRSLLLADHSLASPLGATDVLRVKEDGPQRTVVEVVQGAARFDVVRRPERLFRVEAGKVSVEVLGTSFRVERGRAQVTVAVDRGRVRVLWDGQQRELAAGQRESFPPAAEPRAEAESGPIATEVPKAAEPKAAACPLPALAPLPTCQQPAAAAAPAATAARPMHAPYRSRAVHAWSHPAVQLLREADTARRGGELGAALKLLQELLRDHRKDPRAPLAAFTLGKLQTEELAQPEAAARSFALAQALEPDGPLAEDALAREVEALDAAGQKDHARERAEEYLRRYPQGIRSALVRRHGHVQ